MLLDKIDLIMLVILSYGLAIIVELLNTYLLK